jgi:hypothetical protein
METSSRIDKNSNRKHRDITAETDARTSGEKSTDFQKKDGQDLRGAGQGTHREDLHRGKDTPTEHLSSPGTPQDMAMDSPVEIWNRTRQPPEVQHTKDTRKVDMETGKV